MRYAQRVVTGSANVLHPPGAFRRQGVMTVELLSLIIAVIGWIILLGTIAPEA